jgi:hypothetical protein
MITLIALKNKTHKSRLYDDVHRQKKSEAKNQRSDKLRVKILKGACLQDLCGLAFEKRRASR